MANQKSTDTIAVRKEYVTRLTERIKSLNSPITAPDLQYLYDVTRLQEFDFTSHAGSQESRVQYLLDRIFTSGPEMLFGGLRYLVILITSPEWPLLVDSETLFVVSLAAQRATEPCCPFVSIKYLVTMLANLLDLDF